MTDPTTKLGSDALPPEDEGHEEQPDILPLREEERKTRGSVFSVLSLQSPDRATTLAKRREAKEKKLSPHGFDLNRLWLLNGGDDKDAEPTPLTRSMLMHSTGEQAVVLTAEECGIFGRLSFIDCHGRRHDLDLRAAVPEGKMLILFPEDMGDTEGKPSLRVFNQE
ncbi:MAG: hypothetical protein PHO20_00725 [Candidatus Peribacteraceae bacterium]|nr:hypothetical protein [Candidatus Peribacteraceae bacterium]MDD5739275.1 hypothetical protein [Candidatus Peribacteraceae bacterium]